MRPGVDNIRDLARELAEALSEAQAHVSLAAIQAKGIRPNSPIADAARWLNLEFDRNEALLARARAMGLTV